MIGWLLSSLFLNGEETRSEILRIRIGESPLGVIRLAFAQLQTIAYLSWFGLSEACIEA